MNPGTKRSFDAAECGDNILQMYFIVHERAIQRCREWMDMLMVCNSVNVSAKK